MSRESDMIEDASRGETSEHIMSGGLSVIGLAPALMTKEQYDLLFDWASIPENLQSISETADGLFELLRDHPFDIPLALLEFFILCIVLVKHAKISKSVHTYQINP